MQTDIPLCFWHLIRTVHEAVEVMLGKIYGLKVKFTPPQAM